MVEILWLRRDLRRADHPALRAAALQGPVLPVFVIDPTLWASVGTVRRAWLAHTLRALNESYDGQLCLRMGPPDEVLPALAREIGASRIHLTREFTPWGVRRDTQVAAALEAVGVTGLPTGSPYAVDPGSLTTRAGGPYKVFTPWSKSWLEHDVEAPTEEPADLGLSSAPSDSHAWREIDAAISECTADLLEPGEEAATAQWQDFLANKLDQYDMARDRPDQEGTSQLSPYLRLGVLHPRTLLRDLAPCSGESARRFRLELGWREFYADVLHHRPDSAWNDLNSTLSALPYDDPGADFEAWKTGLTGYPIVDAGMRHLLAEGWMPNRVRMITASFLTKDLHVWWPHGARHFLAHLADGDVASNNHGWQWVAGTGTDASPYFRIFNPTTQGLRFDPDGNYVRRWVPELKEFAGKTAHEPWLRGGAPGYPEPIVDHALARKDALERLAELKQQS